MDGLLVKSSNLYLRGKDASLSGLWHRSSLGEDLNLSKLMVSIGWV